ncbi:MAG: hypothetical protein ACRD6X_06605 [Pyrinomonadaceae bacterium]
MKTFKKLVFTFIAVAGLALSVSAQKEDPKKPPKDPPKVEPRDKEKPRPKPEPTPKKPGMAFIVMIDRKEQDFEMVLI